MPVDGDAGLGRTPLHLAATNGHELVVRLLLSGGATVDARTFGGRRTPLHLAAENGHVDIVRLLLEQGAGQEARDSEGRTPLHLAAIKGNTEAVEALLEHGVFAGSVDTGGRTPLHLAAANGQVGAADMLFKTNGRSLLARDADGMTAFHLAVIGRHHALARQLFDGRLDLTAKIENGGNILHLAASRGYPRLLLMLLKRTNLDRESRDDDGRTPLHLAAKNGHERCTELLLRNRAAVGDGLGVWALDNRRWTPLRYAIDNFHVNTEIVLRNHEADSGEACLLSLSLSNIHWAACCTLMGFSRHKTDPFVWQYCITTHLLASLLPTTRLTRCWFSASFCRVG